MSTNRAEELINEAVRDGTGGVIIGNLSGQMGVWQHLDGRTELRDELTDDNAQSLISEFQTLAYNPVEDGGQWTAHLIRNFDGRAVHLLFHAFQDKGKPSLVVGIVDPAKRRNLSQLGLSADGAAIFEELLSRRSGLILGCASTGNGKMTTFMAALQELAKRGKRVAHLSELPDCGWEGIKYVKVDFPNLASQIEELNGKFDAVGVAFLNISEHIQAAWKLAASGCLVILTANTMETTSALYRMLDSGVSPEEIHAQFLGGWSQTLVRRQEGRGRVALFDCLGPADAKPMSLSREWLGDAERFKEHKRALWRDAEPRIERGELRREDVEVCLV